jgi:RecJ-like exonuclease
MKTEYQNAKDKLKDFHYMKIDNGVVEKVTCKSCGATLQNLIPDENYTKTEKFKGKIIIYKYLVMAQTPNYDELTIEMEDGSKHVTPICKVCKRKSVDVESLYQADLYRLEELGMDLSKMNKRKPKKVTK